MVRRSIPWAPKRSVATPVASPAAAGSPVQTLVERDIRAVIFDLDNTLADARCIGADAFAPAFDAVRSANDGCLSDTQLDAAFAACWHTAYHTVAREHGFSDRMTRAGAQVFRRLVLPAGAGYAGYPDLDALRHLDVARFLVTSGFRRLQESKIDALAIRGLFTGIGIDDADDHWPSPSPGKIALFETIRTRLKLQPRQVLVVGDNPGSEIAAGVALGMPTVQIMRPGVRFSAAAQHHIHSLTELARF